MAIRLPTRYGVPDEILETFDCYIEEGHFHVVLKCRCGWALLLDRAMLLEHDSQKPALLLEIVMDHRRWVSPIDRAMALKYDPPGIPFCPEARP